MNKITVAFLISALCACSLSARGYKVRGPQGGLSMTVTLPDGFNPETDHCPMVILMHGIFSSKDYNPMPALAKGLAQAGADVPLAMVLIAPGSVIKNACQGGKFFNARFDPNDPPEYIRCWGIKKLGREYLLTTQTLDIYGTASAYPGKVLILHGTKDSIVPMWCSEHYKETYGGRAELVVIDGENHMINRRRGEVVSRTVDFFRTVFGIR